MAESDEPNEDDFAELRRGMVRLIAAYAELSGEQTLKRQLDPRVLAVMERIPRHAFVPVEIRPYAYADGPLPIGCGKTVSQPFIVALMTDLLELSEADRVLEIGTGLGYHAAVMAALAQELYSVEIIEELAGQAERRLGELGAANIRFRLGDGYYGWPDHGPYDKILVAAANELVPPPLIEQLKPGGRMVVPTGLEQEQKLTLVEKDLSGHLELREILPVTFAAMVRSH